MERRQTETTKSWDVYSYRKQPNRLVVKIHFDGQNIHLDENGKCPLPVNKNILIIINDNPDLDIFIN